MTRTAWPVYTPQDPELMALVRQKNALLLEGKHIVEDAAPIDAQEQDTSAVCKLYYTKGDYHGIDYGLTG